MLKRKFVAQGLYKNRKWAEFEPWPTVCQTCLPSLISKSCSIFLPEALTCGANQK